MWLPLRIRLSGIGVKHVYPTRRMRSSARLDDAHRCGPRYRLKQVPSREREIRLGPHRPVVVRLLDRPRLRLRARRRPGIPAREEGRAELPIARRFRSAAFSGVEGDDDERDSSARARGSKVSAVQRWSTTSIDIGWPAAVTLKWLSVDAITSTDGWPRGVPAQQQPLSRRSAPARAREPASACILLKTRIPLLDCYRSGCACAGRRASLRARAPTCVQHAVEARKITGSDERRVHACEVDGSCRSQRL